MDAGLLPVKPFADAKGRLAKHFTRAERTAIARALFEDALALCTAADFLSWWVVSADTGVLREASAHGFETLTEDGAGLNAALAGAIPVVMAAGARSVTVIPSDIPLATAGDLMDVLDTGAISDVVIVPSRSDGGTNALYVRPPDLIEPQFGPGSLAAHVKTADDRKLRCSILPSARLELDIDTVEDIDAFLSSERSGAERTAELLTSLRNRT